MAGEPLRVGLQSGYGAQHLGPLALDVAYEYRVWFFQLQLGKALVRRRGWALEVCVQPQVNSTRYRPENHQPRTRQGYEVGINPGLLLRRGLGRDRVSVYALVSIGPHFISGGPPRQARGFLFSDNVLGGLTVRVSAQSHLDLRTGFRHLSSGGLLAPNAGLNTLVVSGGLLWSVGRKN